MKVFILTSSDTGTAAHHLPYLIESNCCKISMVILSDGKVISQRNYLMRKFRKIIKIGILGTLNGFRMRKWYNEYVKKYVSIRSLRDLCIENNIPFYKTSGINSEMTVMLIQKVNADLGISLGNGYISKKIFEAPKYGMINIHHEILPFYQNAQSVIWQLYNGSSSTGYTIHKVNQQIDKGEIILQETIAIDFKNTLSATVASTTANLMRVSAKGLVHLLINFDDIFFNAKAQAAGNSYTTPTIFQFLKIYFNFKRVSKIK